MHPAGRGVNKAGDGKKYPALLVTDGDFTFGSVYESAGCRVWREFLPADITRD